LDTTCLLFIVLTCSRMPTFILLQVVRITVMQSTSVITHYYSDQLKEDMKREERIDNGEITRQEAEREDEEWQEVSFVVSTCANYFA